MEILLVVLGYLFFGLIVFFGMIIMEKKGINFDIRGEEGTVLVITIIASPIVLFVIYPIHIAKYMLK